MFVADRIAPVDTHCAALFLSRPLWRGRIAVAPAGWLTGRLADSVAAAPGVCLVGVIDRHPNLVADGIPARLGLPVAAPDQWSALDCDGIVVLHARRMREITRELRAAGVPETRIHHPLSQPDYQNAVAQALEHRLAQILKTLRGRRPVLILQSSTRRIVPDRVLAALAPSSDMVAVALMEEAEDPDSPFPTLCACGTIHLLERIIAVLMPQAVYLRTGLDSHLLFTLLRRWLPDARIVAEPYDFWSLMGSSEKAFAHATVASPAELAGHRIAERQILREADLVIGKRTGPGWNAFTAGLERAPASYHAGIADDPKPIMAEPCPRSVGAVRIADTTVLEPPSVVTANAATGDGYDNLVEFRRLAAHHPVEFGVFNLLHRGPEDDPIFQRYLTDHAAPPVVYHRRVPLEDLPGVLAGYDYGWLNFGRQIDAPDLGMVLPNRFCGYIGAGLPVIVSDRLSRVAALVETYDAGVVVSSGAADDFGAAISSFDPVRHRRGALALRQNLLTINRRTLEAIATVFAAAPIGAAAGAHHG
jgi:hypothetical protein